MGQVCFFFGSKPKSTKEFFILEFLIPPFLHNLCAPYMTTYKRIFLFFVHVSFVFPESFRCVNLISLLSLLCACVSFVFPEYFLHVCVFFVFPEYCVSSLSS